MYVGHVFLCSAASLKECMKHKLFTCSGENIQIVREMEVGSIVFFLNLDSDTLVGPFTATGSAGAGLELGGWKEVTNSKNKATVRVEWEDVHELTDVKDKFPFLTNINTCKLSHFQTQDLLNALKEAPLINTKQGTVRK